MITGRTIVREEGEVRGGGMGQDEMGWRDREWAGARMSCLVVQ